MAPRIWRRRIGQYRDLETTLTRNPARFTLCEQLHAGPIIFGATLLFVQYIWMRPNGIHYHSLYVVPLAKRGFFWYNILKYFIPKKLDFNIKFIILVWVSWWGRWRQRSLFARQTFHSAQKLLPPPSPYIMHMESIRIIHI